MNTIDSRIKFLKEEIKNLEKKKNQGHMTFEEWEKSQSAALQSTRAIVPISYYSDRQIKKWRGYVHHARRLIYDERGFFEGHQPILMLGAYVTISNGKDYASVQTYVSKVLSRYVCRVLKPTVFTVENWRELWSTLKRRYQERHGIEGIRPIRYMGRREPYFIPEGDRLLELDLVGLDQNPYYSSFMIRGKLFRTFKKDICDYDLALRNSKDRSDIILQFAKQHDKLEILSGKLERL